MWTQAKHFECYLWLRLRYKYHIYMYKLHIRSWFCDAWLVKNNIFQTLCVVFFCYFFLYILLFLQKEVSIFRLIYWVFFFVYIYICLYDVHFSFTCVFYKFNFFFFAKPIAVSVSNFGCYDIAAFPFVWR